MLGLRPLTSGMPQVLQDLQCLLCRTHLFCLWAALFWTTKRYVHVSRDDSLSKTKYLVLKLGDRSAPKKM